MKITKSLTRIATAAAMLMAGGQLAAQTTGTPATTPSYGAGTGQPQGQALGHVQVDLTAVRSDLSQRMNVSESELPASIRLPVGRAASICGVPASDLAPAGSAAPACSATEASSELQAAVQQEMTIGQPSTEGTTSSGTMSAPSDSSSTATPSDSSTSSGSDATTSTPSSSDTLPPTSSGMSTSPSTGDATSSSTTDSATSPSTSDTTTSPSTSEATATPSTTDTTSGTQANTVPVDISALRLDLAERLDIDQDKMPSIVQVPADVAATVCGEASSGMAGGQSASACTAQEASPELESAVRQEVERSPAGR